MLRTLWNYIKGLWPEVEPVFNHTLVAACIAVLVAALVKIFGAFLSHDLAEKLHIVDHFLIVGVFWLLAIYTLSLLLVRLIYHFIKEVIRLYRKVKEDVKGRANGTQHGGAETMAVEEPDQPRLGEPREQTTRPEEVQATRTRDVEETGRRT
jgi:hypothetical protein